MYFTIFWVNDSEKSKGGTLWCKRAPIESKNKDQGFCEMQLLRLFYIKGSPLWYKRASIALKTWIKDFINCIYCGSFTSKGPPFGFFKIIDVLWKKSLNRFKFTKLLILAHCAALERVPQVPVNPSIFLISYKLPLKERKILKNPLKKEFWSCVNPWIEISNAASV